MTVNISKPDINVREKLAELDKPTGIAGEAMLRAETPQEQFNLIGAGRRRLNINGDQRVNQRGTVTSINSAQSNYGGPDRSSMYSNSPSNSATFTVSRESDGPDGFPFSKKTLCTAASSAALSSTQEIKVEHAIEAQDLQGIGYGTPTCKHITISFWCKSNQNGTIVLWLYRPDGQRHTSVPVSITSPDTWEYKEVTIQPDVEEAVTYDTSAGLFVSFILNSGPSYTSGTSPNGVWEDLTNANRYVGITTTIGNTISDYFQFTGVQVELGKVATPFEHRSYAEELALCQRYYYRASASELNGSLCAGFATGSTGARGIIDFPVTMRVAPTGIEHTGSAANYKVAYSATATTCTAVPSFSNASTNAAGVQFTASGLTAGHGIAIERNSGTAYIGFTGAEL